MRLRHSVRMASYSLVGFRDKSCPDEHVHSRVLITVLHHSAMPATVHALLQSDWRIGYLPAFGASLRGICRVDRDESATVLDGLPMQCIWISVAMAASWAFRAMLVFDRNFGLKSSLAMMSLRSHTCFAHVWAMVSRCATMRRQSLRYCALAFL